MIFEAVHQPSAVSLDLLGSRNCKKYDLREFLAVKGAEHTSTKDHGSLVLLLLYDDHGLMDTVHNQANDVWTWHPWELLGDNIFEVD